MKLPKSVAEGFNQMVDQAKGAMERAQEIEQAHKGRKGPERHMKTETKTLEVKKSFSVPAERVFDAWLDPKIAAKFLFVTPDGEIIRCDIDARVGGSFVIVRRDSHGDTEHVGDYEVIDRPDRLVFTFGVPKFTPDRTRVSIDFKPTSLGCDLTMTHEGVWADWTEKTVEGWKMILGNLERVLA